MATSQLSVPAHAVRISWPRVTRSSLAYGSFRLARPVYQEGPTRPPHLAGPSTEVTTREQVRSSRCGEGPGAPLPQNVALPRSAAWRAAILREISEATSYLMVR